MTHKMTIRREIAFSFKVNSADSDKDQSRTKTRILYFSISIFEPVTIFVSEALLEPDSDNLMTGLNCCASPIEKSLKFTIM
jgi:hypothetical protein